MLRDAPAVRRSTAVLGAGLLAGLVLTGCGGATPTRTAPAAATHEADRSDEPSAADSALAPGLLPADAFGADAEVHRFFPDGAPFGGGGHRWGHRWDDGEPTVTPAECATALERATSSFTGVEDAAAQVARTDGVRTFQVLAVPATSTETDVVAAVRAVADACASVTIDRGDGDDDHGPATVRVEPLDAPEDMAAFRVSVSGERPGGTWDATSLVGIAQDGDRVLGLAQMSWDEEPDPASFTALLERAYDTASDALD
ncbi:hypothetical protein [Geodermatophilus sp. SYSU D00815]